MHPITRLFSDAVHHLHDEARITAMISRLYAADASFEDPVQIARGRPAILGAFRVMARAFKGIEFSVLGEAESRDTLVIHWEMGFRFHGWPITTRVPGVSWISLDGEGRILHQVDYWDVWTFMRRLAPLPDRLRKALPGPLRKWLD